MFKSNFINYFFVFFFISTNLLFGENYMMKYIPINTEDSFKRIQEGTIVIDVRYSSEHNKIRIENSYNIPFNEIQGFSFRPQATQNLENYKVAGLRHPQTSKNSFLCLSTVNN